MQSIPTNNADVSVLGQLQFCPQPQMDRKRCRKKRCWKIAEACGKCRADRHDCAGPVAILSPAPNGQKAVPEKKMLEDSRGVREMSRRQARLPFLTEQVQTRPRPDTVAYHILPSPPPPLTSAPEHGSSVP